MTKSTETPANDSFFRCPVVGDCADACLKIGRRRMKVTVQDTSIDGFTVLVSSAHSKHLRVGEPWILEFDDTRTETLAQWFHHGLQGQTQVGLRRMRDLTPVQQIGSWYTGLLPSKSRNSGTDATVAYAGFTILLFLTMALPGLGDYLGTANRIESAAAMIFQGIASLW
jgi:hypothetical protein